DLDELGHVLREKIVDQTADGRRAREVGDRLRHPPPVLALLELELPAAARDREPGRVERRSGEDLLALVRVDGFEQVRGEARSDEERLVLPFDAGGDRIRARDLTPDRKTVGLRAPARAFLPRNGDDRARRREAVVGLARAGRRLTLAGRPRDLREERRKRAG